MTPEVEIPHLEIRALTVAFPQSTGPVLQSLNLRLKREDNLIVIGPGGQGKTVLLKTIAGLYRPSEGSLNINGKEIWTLPADEKRSLTSEIAMSFQRSGLFDSLDAIENLLFPLEEVLGITGKEATHRAKALMDKVGLAGQEDKFPHEMSGGMQKRLCIARAIAMNPNLILYDDPTAGLDPVTSLSILELILETKYQSKATLILTTSDVDLALHMARETRSPIAFLYQGRILSIETHDSILNSNHPVIAQFVKGDTHGPLEQND